MKAVLLVALLCFALASSVNLERRVRATPAQQQQQQQQLSPNKSKLDPKAAAAVIAKKFTQQDPTKAESIEKKLKEKATSKPAPANFKKVDATLLASVSTGLAEYEKAVQGSKGVKDLNSISFGWDKEQNKPVLTFSFKKGTGSKCPPTVPKTIICDAVEESLPDKATAKLAIGDAVAAHQMLSSVGACLTTGLPPPGLGDYIVSSWHGAAQRYDDVTKVDTDEVVGWVSTWPMPQHNGDNDFDLAYLSAGHNCICPGKHIATEGAATLKEFVTQLVQAYKDGYDPELTVEGTYIGQGEFAAKAKMDPRRILWGYKANNINVDFTNMFRVNFQYFATPSHGDSGGALYMEGNLLGITSGGGKDNETGRGWAYFTPIWNVAEALRANANHLNFC